MNAPLLNLRVAVAFIIDEAQHVLITQRAPHLSHGGYWEFPGGKLEQNESPEIALLREVEEEVGLAVLAYRYLGEVHHAYESYRVTLYGYLVHHYRGSATCRETQTDLRWVTREACANYPFPEANTALIDVAWRECDLLARSFK